MNSRSPRDRFSEPRDEFSEPRDKFSEPRDRSSENPEIDSRSPEIDPRSSTTTEEGPPEDNPLMVLAVNSIFPECRHSFLLHRIHKVFFWQSRSQSSAPYIGFDHFFIIVILYTTRRSGRKPEPRWRTDLRNKLRRQPQQNWPREPTTSRKQW